MPFTQPQLVECVVCDRPVSIHAASCPHCGQPEPSLIAGTGKTRAQLDWEQSEEGKHDRAMADRKRENHLRALFLRSVGGYMLLGALLSLALVFVTPGFLVLSLGLAGAGWWLRRRAHGLRAWEPEPFEVEEDAVEALPFGKRRTIRRRPRNWLAKLLQRGAKR